MKTIILLLLAKKKPFSITLPLLAAYHRFYSASATQNQVPKHPNFIVDEYLKTSCGFSMDKAAKISKRLTHLKSPEKPDSVLRFLNHQGFSEAEIHTLISLYPPLLSSSAETTLEPNLDALQNIGLSSSTLTKIILTCPEVLQLLSSVPRIKFWLDFFGGDEADLIKAFKRSRRLIGLEINKNIVPKISLLQSHGFSTHDIKRMVLLMPRFFHNSIGLIEKLLERAEELGFHPESGMFVIGLQAVYSVSKETLQRKIGIFKSFGWSESEFLSAFHKTPNIVKFSEENLRAKMEFLLGEVTCGPSYIATNPGLLAYSLEKRMRPRQHVLHLLESNKLPGKEREQRFHSLMKMSNNKFMEKYITSTQERDFRIS